MALPTETTGYTYGWSPNDFIQNFLAEGSDNRGGSDKGAMESLLSILEGDVVQLGTGFRQVKAYDGDAGLTYPVIGVALSDAVNGKLVPISCGPIVKCRVGTAVTRGNFVSTENAASADGKIEPVTPTGGGTLQGMLGIALNGGDADDIIPILMKGSGITFVG